MMRILALVGLSALVITTLLISLSRSEPPVASRRLVAFIADTNGVARGAAITYAGISIGEVTSARRMGDLTRLDFRLTRADVPLRTGDRLRRIVSPLGFMSRLAVVGGPANAPVTHGRRLARSGADTGLADSVSRASAAIPGLVRDVRKGVDEIKKRPQLYQP
jgi:hypothetical protein